MGEWIMRGDNTLYKWLWDEETEKEHPVYVHDPKH
jgi:hypothetical protein